MSTNDTLRIPELTPWETARFWVKAGPSSVGSCWEWPECKKRYGEFHLIRDGVDTPYKAHRIAWSLINGEIPDGMHICHECDNTRCINPRHLFLGTHEDNHRDKVRKGRHVKGNMVFSAIIDEHIVREIRSRAESGEAYKDIARSLGVSYAIVRNVVVRHTWKHVS